MKYPTVRYMDSHVNGEATLRQNAIHNFTWSSTAQGGVPFHKGNSDDIAAALSVYLPTILRPSFPHDD
jgi:hypothetical protein